MSAQCQFGSAADARAKGFFSRRYHSIADRDVAVEKHLLKQWNELTEEQRKYKLPIGVRHTVAKA